MNKQGQIMDYPILMAALLIVGIIIVAPFLLKFINMFKDNLPAQVQNVTGGEQAAKTATDVLTTASNSWDAMLAFLVIGVVLVLLVSSFMIDTSPFWIILYIILNLLLVLFLPDIVSSMGNIYSASQFATENNQLTFMGFILTHFGELLVGIMVLCGIIIFGKIAFFSNNGGSRV